MKHSLSWIVAALLLVSLGLGSYQWWQHERRAVPVSAPTPIAPSPIAVELSPPVKPVVRYPVAVERQKDGAPVTLPTLANSDRLVKDALIGMIAGKSLLSFLNIDDFVRHLVSTLDNLARGRAASRLWPVWPTPGHLLPVFQQAYEELGYPGKYFNDRLVEVIDQLLETPELTGPVKLTLTQVQGPIAATKPWLRYEFAEPSLETRPAGQKILLRMGSTNAHLLKQKLAEFRAHHYNW